MRKSMLTWRGEWEQIPGMYLILSYEPGCDVLQTQFVPPEEMPEEQKWKGPTLFSATRIPKPPEPEPVVEEAPAEVVVPPKPVVNPPSQKKEETKPAKTPSIPEDAPKVLWLSGRADISGCYELMPSELQNERPVYKEEKKKGLASCFYGIVVVIGVLLRLFTHHLSLYLSWQGVEMRLGGRGTPWKLGGYAGTFGRAADRRNSTHPFL
jgi:hypothetical protein